MPSRPAAVRARTIHAGGIPSPVLESGPPDRDDAVVFLHGNPGSSEDWRDLLPDVGAFARAVAVDMPGFGRAGKPEDFDYSVTGFTRHLGALFDTLRIRRAHLVLHDFGAAWGLAWGVSHPDRFASAAMINIGVLPGYRWHVMARLWRTPVVGELVMAATTRTGVRLALAGSGPPRLPPAFVDRMYRDFDRNTRRAVLRLYRATPDPGGEPSRQLAAALRALDRPALVLWGARDPFVPVRFAQLQRDAFPHARIVVLAHSGHWPFVDDPERCRAELVPFLLEQTHRR